MVVQLTYSIPDLKKILFQILKIASRYLYVCKWVGVPFGLPRPQVVLTTAYGEQWSQSVQSISALGKQIKGVNACSALCI